MSNYIYYKMSNYENIEYILKKRQDNINDKKMWFDGLTDEEYKIYNRYYIKKLRENPEKREAERKYSSEKITCECGCVVVRSYISKHIKTTRHTEMLEDKKLLSKDQLEKLNEILETSKYEISETTRFLNDLVASKVVVHKNGVFKKSEDSREKTENLLSEYFNKREEDLE